MDAKPKLYHLALRLFYHSGIITSLNFLIFPHSKMPYFPKYNTLFIHIPKNAGSSVENFLELPVEWGLNSRPNHSFLYRLLKKIINNSAYLRKLNQSRHKKIVEMTQMLFGYSLDKYALQHATLSEIISLQC